MAAEFSLFVNDVSIKTSEALYQTCRFPHMPEVQKLIVAEKSPISAKMRSREYQSDTRSDWNDVRILIMEWVLKVKLVQNWETFSSILLSTDDLVIVEQSKNDDFWGAIPQYTDTLVGRNILGWLLTELREIIRYNPKSLEEVQSLNIPNFRLFDKDIIKISKINNDNLFIF